MHWALELFDGISLEQSNLVIVSVLNSLVSVPGPHWGGLLMSQNGSRQSMKIMPIVRLSLCICSCSISQVNALMLPILMQRDGPVRMVALQLMR